MNHKGQVLVAFVMILPVLIILIGMLYDFGNVGLEKRKAVSSIKDTITYGINHIKDENIENKMTNLLKENIKNIEKYKIEIKEDTIKIDLIIKVDGNFKHLFDKNLYRIKLSYQGYIEDGKVKIEG